MCHAVFTILVSGILLTVVSSLALGNTTLKVRIPFSSQVKLLTALLEIFGIVCDAIFTFPVSSFLLTAISPVALGNTTWKVRILFSSHVKPLLGSFTFGHEICGTVFMRHSLYFLGQQFPTHCNISCVFTLGNTTQKVRIPFSSQVKLLLGSFALTQDICSTVWLNLYFPHQQYFRSLQ